MLVPVQAAASCNGSVACFDCQIRVLLFSICPKCVFTFRLLLLRHRIIYTGGIRLRALASSNACSHQKGNTAGWLCQKAHRALQPRLVAPGADARRTSGERCPVGPTRRRQIEPTKAEHLAKDQTSRGRPAVPLMHFVFLHCCHCGMGYAFLQLSCARFVFAPRTWFHFSILVAVIVPIAA